MRTDFCKHYRGTYERKACDAGVIFKDLVGDDPGWFLRLPCCENHKDPVPCDRQEWYTEAEKAERERLIRESSERTSKAIQAIGAKIGKLKKGEGASGVVDCPNCGKRLGYSISSYNHHLHARCETTGCVHFMQ